MTARVTMDQWHRYGIDGRRAIAVTTAIGTLNKPALAPAAAKETAAYAATHADEVEARGVEAWKADVQSAYRRVWNASRDEGSAVHKIAESLIYGDPLPEVDDKGQPWPETVHDMAAQLARWFDRAKVEPVVHEAIVFHERHWWAGTLDLIADIDGERWLVDYKTGASGVWPESALQLSAYRHASHIQVGENVQLMPQVDRAAVLWVRPDKYALIPVIADEKVYGYFLHALALHPFTKIDRDELILPPAMSGGVKRRAAS